MSVPVLPTKQDLDPLSRGLFNSASPLIQKGEILKDTKWLTVRLRFFAYTFYQQSLKSNMLATDIQKAFCTISYSYCLFAI